MRIKQYQTVHRCKTRRYLEVAGASADNRAGVGNTGSLDLQVGQSLELVVSQSVGRLRKRYGDQTYKLTDHNPLSDKVANS